MQQSDNSFKWVSKEDDSGVSIASFRERVAKLEPSGKPADVVFFNTLIPIHEDVNILVKIYKPRNVKKHLGTLFYIPGTSFIARKDKVTQLVCSHIAQLACCQVIVIDHRLAPENPIPIPFLDSYDVFKFFIERKLAATDKFSIDHNRIALAGYSSGGNITALMAIKAKQEGIPILRQILISPIVDFSRSLKRFLRYENQDSDISDQFVNWTLNLCLPNGIYTRDPEISPFWTSKEKIKGLCQTIIVFAEYDRFRSDSELYYEKLLDAGVSVEKLLIDKENHSHLWRKFETVEKIAKDILKIAFTEKH